MKWNREIDWSPLMTISFRSSRPTLHLGVSTGIFLFETRSTRNAVGADDVSLLSICSSFVSNIEDYRLSQISSKVSNEAQPAQTSPFAVETTARCQVPA